MNNNQFRKLLLDQQSSPKDDASSSSTSTSVRGARKSFMPMTPRTVKGGIDIDFARQVRERNAALNPSSSSQPTTKKFKSYAPKGSKFLAGYTDRAKARQEAGDEEEVDEKAARVKALEEQMKQGEISREVFEGLRDEITGGELGNTHLVKGLDWRLLERVKRGENVFKQKEEGEGEVVEEKEVYVDDELDRLEEKEVEGVKREAVVKKGSLAGKKRNRDEIMAEFKAQRAAAKEAALAEQRAAEEAAKPKIEIDHKGREVIMVVGEDGRVKKKVRKMAPQAKAEEKIADPPAKTRLPSPPREEHAPAQEDDDDDDDIFAEAGTDYNPLGDQPDDDDDEDEDMDDVKEPKTEQRTTNLTKSATGSEASDSEDENELHEQPSEATPASETTQPKRNYFNDKPSAEDEDKPDQLAGLKNILKKAAKMDSTRTEDSDAEDDDPAEAERKARLKKRAQMLAQSDRDMEDMDMGFGGSRFEDEEDGGDAKVKLSKWKDGAGEDDEDGGKGGGKGGGKQKKKSKKRKGDVNNIDDIMRVVESRKAAEK